MGFHPPHLIHGSVLSFATQQNRHQLQLQLHAIHPSTSQPSSVSLLPLCNEANEEGRAGGVRITT